MRLTPSSVDRHAILADGERGEERELATDAGRPDDAPDTGGGEIETLRRVDRRRVGMREVCRVVLDVGQRDAAGLKVFVDHPTEGRRSLVAESDALPERVLELRGPSRQPSGSGRAARPRERQATAARGYVRDGRRQR